MRRSSPLQVVSWRCKSFVWFTLGVSILFLDAVFVVVLVAVRPQPSPFTRTASSNLSSVAKS